MATSTSRLSSSTLSLRFMQNASRDKIDLDQAKVLDDSQWEVSKDVRDMWARSQAQKDQYQHQREVTEESSYLPFILQTSQATPLNDSTDFEAPQSRRKRKFGLFPNEKLPSPTKRDDAAEKTTQDEAELEDNDEEENQESKPPPSTSSLSVWKSNRPLAKLSRGTLMVQMAKQSLSKSSPNNQATANTTPLDKAKNVEPIARFKRPDVHVPKSTRISNVATIPQSGEASKDSKTKRKRNDSTAGTKSEGKKKLKEAL